jgi:hypothetical protein
MLAAGVGLLVITLLMPSGSPLSFMASGADYGSSLAIPGQDQSYAAFLNAEPAGFSYHIVKVTLIPLPGFRTPQLVGAVILAQNQIPLEAEGFPPIDPSNGKRLAVRALEGFTAVSGLQPYRPPTVIMFGISGADIGAYAVAGISVTYETQGRRYAANIYNAAILLNCPNGGSTVERQRYLSELSILSARVEKVLYTLPGVKAVLAWEAVKGKGLR